MGCLRVFGIIFLVFLTLCDIVTDVATAADLYLAEHYVWASITLGFVFLPGVLAAIGEIARTCVHGERSQLSSFFLFTAFPLYILFVQIQSICHGCVKDAMYLKSVEGFIESAPQITLQVMIVMRGVIGTSLYQLFHYENGQDSDFVLDKSSPHADSFSPLDDTFSSIDSNESHLKILLSNAATNRSLDWNWYWGLIQLASIASAFLSVLYTSVYFNEMEKRTMSCRTMLSIPFFFFTILYRVGAMALLLAYFKLWALIPIFSLIAGNIFTFLCLGLDTPRSILYGVCSLVAPAGYNRDPSSPIGYTGCNTTEYPGYRVLSSQGIEERARIYIAQHLLLGSVFILGSSILVLAFLVNFDGSNFNSQLDVVFDSNQLNYYVLPALATSLLASLAFSTFYCCCLCCTERYANTYLA